MSHEHATPSNPANGPSAAFFAGIGLRPGMRVLDIGCGNGDLSRLLARLAGPQGEVVAIDRSQASLDAASEIPAGQDTAPIHYRTADLAAGLPDLGTFDAIVGRRVLMYLPDVSATLTALAALATPTTILAFQEHARAGLPLGTRPLPAHDRLYQLMWDTVAAEGGDVHLPLRLPGLLTATGFRDTALRSEAILLAPQAP